MICTIGLSEKNHFNKCSCRSLDYIVYSDNRTGDTDNDFQLSSTNYINNPFRNRVTTRLIKLLHSNLGVMLH